MLFCLHTLAVAMNTHTHTYIHTHTHTLESWSNLHSAKQLYSQILEKKFRCFVSLRRHSVSVELQLYQKLIQGAQWFEHIGFKSSTPNNNNKTRVQSLQILITKSRIVTHGHDELWHTTFFPWIRWFTVPRYKTFLWKRNAASQFWFTGWLFHRLSITFIFNTIIVCLLEQRPSPISWIFRFVYFLSIGKPIFSRCSPTFLARCRSLNFGVRHCHVFNISCIFKKKSCACAE